MSEHAIVDLETLSRNSNAQIISIGAVKFNSETLVIRDAFYINIDKNSCIDLFDIEHSTVEWWDKQSIEAKSALEINKTDMYTALTVFSRWINADDRLWGNGAGFDNVILGNAYKAFGIKQPWSYKNDRCFRTMRKMFVTEDAVAEGTNHNALDDAIWEAKHLIKICKEFDIRLN